MKEPISTAHVYKSSYGFLLYLALQTMKT